MIVHKANHAIAAIGGWSRTGFRSGGAFSPVNAGLLKIGTVALLAGFAPLGYHLHLTDPAGDQAQARQPDGAEDSRRALLQQAESSETTGQPGLRDAALIRDAGVFGTAKPFFYHGANSDKSNAVDCLAAAAWYEAGNDPEGQRAVIQIVINRLSHPSFPKSVCGVVFQGSERTTGCQFTFTCDGSLNRRFPSPVAWRQAQARAQKALDGGVDESVGKATHYHASYVQPWWSGKLERLTSVGSHIFYRWPGSRGAFENAPRLSTERDFDTLVSDSKARAAGQDGQAAVAQLVAGPLDGEQSAMAGEAQVNLPPASQAIFLHANGYGTSGRWAVTAMNACVDRQDCQVLVYGDANAAERNRRLAAVDRDRPLFVFIRDKTSAMNIALWDCQRITRPDASQCLPTSGPKLQQLMRERYATSLRDSSPQVSPG